MTGALKKSKKMVVRKETVMPENLLLKLPSGATEMVTRRFNWLSNEEIASILVNFAKHDEWLTKSRVSRPENGRILMFNRKLVRYRQDMYTWKTKKKSKWPREDHVKLKVDGIACITALYVHSDILPTFHRRCYWFIQNPDIVLVHYLNFPYLDDGNRVTSDLALNRRCEQWEDLAKEDVVEQLRPMFADMPWPRLDGQPLSPEQVNAVINKLVDGHYSNFYSPLQTHQRTGKAPLRAIEPKILLTVNGNQLDPSPTTSGQTQPSNITTYQLVTSNYIPRQKSQATRPPQQTPLQIPLSTPGELAGSAYFVVPSSNLNDCAYIPQNGHPVHDARTPQAIHEEGRPDAIPPGACGKCPPATKAISHTAPGTTSTVTTSQFPLTVSGLPQPRSTANARSDASNRFPCPSQIVIDFLKHESGRVSVAGDACAISTGDCAHSDPNGLALATGVQARGDDVGVAHSNCLTGAGLSSNNAEPTEPVKSSSSLFPAAFKESVVGCYAKDAMVPNFRNDLLHPAPSPFNDAAPCTVNTNPPDLNVDVFDVDNLFNMTAPSINTSMDSALSTNVDETNLSTESSVGDLFSQQLWGDAGISAPNSYEDDQSDVGLGMQLSVTSDRHSAEFLPDELLDAITDYSPDWSYAEGGVKVLLTGTWTQIGNYQCVFGNIAVPTTRLQAGVLRCYCPAHDPGYVNLHITRDGRIVTSPVKFEYKSIPTPYCGLNTRWLQLNENEFKMSILERLERMEERLNSISQTSNSPASGNSHNVSQRGTVGANSGENLEPLPATPAMASASDFEERLIQLCYKINDACRTNQQPEVKERDGKALTVLHYSAALGYSRLVNAMHSLRLQSDNVFLQSECDPQNVDKFDCTPLMWASACGQLDCAESLCNWSATELRSLDVLGRSPAAVARQRGHMRIYNRLEELIESRSNLRDDDACEEDDVDNSSIGDTTASGTLDSLDSGEDSMETDDNFSSDCLPPTPRFDMHLFPELIADNPQDGSVNSESSADNMSSLLPGNGASGFVACGDFFENRDSVASLAEKVVQCAPNYVKGKVHSRAGPDSSAAEDLTLRSLPQFVTSHCERSYFGNSDSNQQCSEFGSLLDWSDFLRQPPRKMAPSSGYRNAVELQLDSLRLTEHEYCQLFVAANTILNAYHCEGSTLSNEVLRAYLLIQHCYAKYEKFALSKKMNEAAVLIQSKFRSYQEQKRFQRSRHAAILIQSFYRSYKCARACKPGGSRSSKHTVKLIEDALRGHMTKKKQHQAARKIQRFLRRCQLRSKLAKASETSYT